jgi:hypothetical protein
MELDMQRTTLALTLLWTIPAGTAAQEAADATSRPPSAEVDLQSIGGVLTALYGAVQRPPGEGFRWDLLRAVAHPEAVMIPSTEQQGGQMVVMSVEEFIAWGDEFAGGGGPDDPGFAEEEIARRVERYGDVAQVFSTYQAHFWDDDEILARGINAITLVWNEGRWWLTAIAWDEEVGAGPIPDAYLPH